MIKEQSIEWNISFYVNFIDIERAFDSLHREILWRQLFHYGIFTKLIILIKDIYSDMKWQVVHGGNTNGEFEIKTSERQSTFLGFFVLVNDQIKRETLIGNMTQRRFLEIEMTEKGLS